MEIYKIKFKNKTKISLNNEVEDKQIENEVDGLELPNKIENEVSVNEIITNHTLFVNNKIQELNSLQNNFKSNLIKKNK